MQHAVDADAGDRRAWDGRQQSAAQRVAEGVAEARLEWFDDEPRPVVGDGLFRQRRTLRDEHGVSFRKDARYMTSVVGYSVICCTARRSAAPAVERRFVPAPAAD